MEHEYSVERTYALMNAVKQQDHKLIKWLLKHGADPLGIIDNNITQKFIYETINTKDITTKILFIKHECEESNMFDSVLDSVLAKNNPIYLDRLITVLTDKLESEDQFIQRMAIKQLRQLRNTLILATNEMYRSVIDRIEIYLI